MLFARNLLFGDQWASTHASDPLNSSTSGTFFMLASTMPTFLIELSMKTILYLRTDLGTRELTSGGSITHTLGVLDGLLAQNNTIYCASSAMYSTLSERAHKKNMHFKALWLPRFLQVLGFKIR